MVEPVRSPRSPFEETGLRTLYADLLQAWNDRNASAMAALIAEDGIVVGFDGSTMRGPQEVETTLSGIFAHHATPAYVSKIKAVSWPGEDVGLIQAVAGMVPAGQFDINPALNAIQTLVASREGNAWKIRLFQNTPAAFHGRPEAAEVLTQELRDALRGK